MSVQMSETDWETDMSQPFRIPELPHCSEASEVCILAAVRVTRKQF